MPELTLTAGTIEFEDTGGEGPVLLLLHGLMMDGSLWRKVLRELDGHRCVIPVLPLGGHRRAMDPGADLTMRGIARLVAELIERLDLQDVTLVLNDWGGAILTLSEPSAQRITRLALCSCEAFENVPPKGAARLLPHLARIPGGLRAAVAPLALDPLRRLPVTYGPLSHEKVPRLVMDRWFGPVVRDAGVRRDLRKYVLSSPAARRDLLAATERLTEFPGPALVAWAQDDLLMPIEHGPRLADLLPGAVLARVEGSRTLIPEDQPAELARLLRELAARPAL
jgi:pimeloyl-ACP methyl ester carboxylesterase